MGRLVSRVARESDRAEDCLTRDPVAAAREENLLLLASGMKATGSPRLAQAARRLLDELAEAPRTISPYLLRRAQETRLVPPLWQLAADLEMQGCEDLAVLAHIHGLAQERLFGEAEPAIEALESRGVSPALIKGSDYVWSLYPQGQARQMADVDLLIKPQFLDVTIEQMHTLGFRQGAFNRETFVITALSDPEFETFLQGHYEMPPFLKLVRCPELEDARNIISQYCLPRDYLLPCGEEMWLLVQIDVHYNLSFDLSLDVIWRRTRDIVAWGKLRPALSWETQVWFLPARLYVEATEQRHPVLRNFVDLLAVLDRATDLDWDYVLEVGELYGLFHAFHYVFDLVSQLDQGLIPADVLAHCREAAFAERAAGANHGPLLPTLLDTIEPQRV